jgi:hypothetical protein
MGGGNRCGGYTLLRVAMICWLMGLWSTQAKVEGIMLRAAWHWGRDGSIVNDPPGESGLLSAWGSRDSDLMFFPIL